MHSVGMRTRFITFLLGFSTPLVALAANEGVPSYYQTSTTNANQQAYTKYEQQGYTKYVGQSGRKQVVGTNTYSYQVPRPQIVDMDAISTTSGVMTTNGIAMPVDENKTHIYAEYTRRFADFKFETGVNSILEWDDMIFNEITVGGRHNFSLRNFDMFAYAQYSYGTMAGGGLSMDYDMAPFDWAYPEYGIFTISMGDQSGRSNHLRFGLGAHHIWDIAGWKLSPSIGYEIFKHDLKMSNHLYPNPGVYIPALTESGDYIFGYEDPITGKMMFQAIPQAAAGSVPDDWYQVCMTPEDVAVVPDWPGGAYGDVLPGGVLWKDDGSYSSPWGVGPNECIVIGGDGPIEISGTTHIYNTTWSGLFVGLEIEKQMTLKDYLRFYVQLSLPKYSSEGIWPNRDDWQQNPSFIDEGDNGAYSYSAEMEYTMQLSERLKLSLKADMNYFHVGAIGGELYIAGYTDCVRDEDGYCALADPTNPESGIILENVPAHTEHITDSLKKAVWQSFGLSIGFKYAF